MKPSIAFIIFRMNCYRLMASAIDAALQRGWHVECWHDIGTATPNRALDFPTVANAPTFRNGKVTFREYRGNSELKKLLEKKTVDAVVNLTFRQDSGIADWQKRPNRPFYILIEPTPCDWFFHVRNPEELRQVDLFALTTPYWLEQDVQLLKEILSFPFTPEIEAEFRQKALPVGWSQVDQLALIDPTEVRKKWGIPEGKPVVVYLNWPDHTGWGFREEMFQTTSLVRKAKVLLRYRKKWKTTLEVLRESDIGQVTKAVRDFCDRNNAYLIVKYRNRDCEFLPETQIADKVIFDEAYYPHSIFEVMSIASLSTSYFSAGVRESVAAGVPHLVFDVAGIADQNAWGEKIPFGRQQSKPGGLWNYEGVVHLMNAEQIISQLPQMSLTDFRLNPKAQQNYYEKYLGIPNRMNSNRFLDAVQRLVKSDDYFPFTEKVSS